MSDPVDFAIHYCEIDAEHLEYNESRRREIEKFIVSFSKECIGDPDGGISTEHQQNYSSIYFDTCYGYIDEFCDLPDALVEEYPDIEFEFHRIAIFGDCDELAWIYDGKQLYFRTWDLMESDWQDYIDEDEEEEDTEENSVGSSSDEQVFDDSDPFRAPNVVYYDTDTVPYWLYLW